MEVEPLGSPRLDEKTSISPMLDTSSNFLLTTVVPPPILPTAHRLGFNQSPSSAPATVETVEERKIPAERVSQSQHRNTAVQQGEHQEVTGTIADQHSKETRLILALDQHKKLEQLQNDLVVARSRLANEQNVCTAAYEFARESQENLIKAVLDGIKTQSLNESTYDPLTILCRQAQTDLAIHHAQINKLKDLESSAQRLEFKVWQAEEKFTLETNRALNDLMPEDLAYETRSAQPSSPGSDAESSDSAPSALRAYWDALGDFEMLEAEIFDLDRDHQFDVAEYERLMEQERLVEKHRDEIDNEWEHRRHEIEDEMRRCTKMLEARRMRCVSQDVDINAPRKPPSQISRTASPPKPSRETTQSVIQRATFRVPVAQSEPILSNRPMLTIRQQSGARPASQTSEQARMRVMEWLSKGTQSASADFDVQDAQPLFQLGQSHGSPNKFMVVKRSTSGGPASERRGSMIEQKPRQSLPSMAQVLRGQSAGNDGSPIA